MSIFSPAQLEDLDLVCSNRYVVREKDYQGKDATRNRFIYRTSGNAIVLVIDEITPDDILSFHYMILLMKRGVVIGKSIMATSIDNLPDQMVEWGYEPALVLKDAFSLMSSPANYKNFIR